jgi:RHS repeat-associated protein
LVWIIYLLGSLSAHCFFSPDGKRAEAAVSGSTSALSAADQVFCQSLVGSGIRSWSKDRHEGPDLPYYGYRFYNASTGRWLNRDPIGEDGGVNLFALVRNDPVGISDSLGLSALEIPYTAVNGTLHVSDNEHDNFLIFNLKCDFGWKVTKIKVKYDNLSMYHGLWEEFQSNPRHEKYDSEASYTGHVAAVLNGNFGGPVPPPPVGNCFGIPVEQRAFMRTRLVSPGYVATALRVGQELPYNIYGTQQLYVRFTSVDYVCRQCCSAP